MKGNSILQIEFHHEYGMLNNAYIKTMKGSSILQIKFHHEYGMLNNAYIKIL
ncbi:hypothetical protein [Dysgonomonas sp. Marseille-P4361]|uniref:hypothetical protein n=1 Tax=Dysgonomonas sp. Marseille-P4361 TaxID=2161820 RepID=UPI001357CF86|nr:hypothetical protein [Dysgonomonas sp. Marseille-P4361]